MRQFLSYPGKLFWYSLSIFCIFILYPAPLNATIEPFYLEITSGIAHTSGGSDGGGIGDVPITGSFILNIDYDAHYAALQEIDISPYIHRFDWSSLVGSIYGTDIYLSSPNPIGIPNYLSGTFDGTTAYLTGTISQPAYDGLQYDCDITAVVPEPATICLLSLGGLALLRKRRCQPLE